MAEPTATPCPITPLMARRRSTGLAADPGGMSERSRVRARPPPTARGRAAQRAGVGAPVLAPQPRSCAPRPGPALLALLAGAGRSDTKRGPLSEPPHKPRSCAPRPGPAFLAGGLKTVAAWHPSDIGRGSLGALDPSSWTNPIRTAGPPPPLPDEAPPSDPGPGRAGPGQRHSPPGDETEGARPPPGCVARTASRR